MTDKRPNVLWIMCDELRADALSCYGPALAQIQTPGIDRLAHEGTLFEQFFVNSPVCLPSRTSFLTGLYPEQTGTYHNEAFAPGFPIPQVQTFTEQLVDAGYRTVNFGKVHVPRSLDPFQVSNTDGSLMSDVYDSKRDQGDVVTLPGVDHVLGGVYSRPEPFRPAQLTDNVIQFLSEEASSEEPFLVCASYLQPHTPVVPPEPFASLYDPTLFPKRPQIQAELSDFEKRFAQVVRGEELGPEDFQQVQAAYHGLVAWLDSEIQRLLSAIDELDSDRELVIVFTADHGAYLGENGAFGKHTFAPQCQRVPFIVRGASAAAGEHRADFSQAVDFAPTVLALAGIPWEGPGRDLFAGEEPEAVFGTIGFGGPTSLLQPVMGTGTFDDDHAWPRRTCVRSAGFRLDMNVRIDGVKPQPDLEDVFLADMRNDPEELVNLANDPRYSEERSRLIALVEEHIAGAHETPDEVVSRLFAQSGNAGDSH